MRPPPEICPHCGAEVPPDAAACPECGSDYDTGWSEDADAQRLGLPDDKFDYDEFVKEEFGGAKQATRPKGTTIAIWIVSFVLLLAMLLLLLSR